VGCQRVRGELLKLGVKVYATTIFAQHSSAEVRALLERVVGQLKGRFGRSRICLGAFTTAIGLIPTTDRQPLRHLTCSSSSPSVLPKTGVLRSIGWL